MDIKKCKVEKNCEWSAAVVKGLAVTLGLSALVSLEGCAGNAAKMSNDLVESIPPSSSSYPHQCLIRFLVHRVTILKKMKR